MEFGQAEYKWLLTHNQLITVKLIQPEKNHTRSRYNRSLAGYPKRLYQLKSKWTLLFFDMF